MQRVLYVTTENPYPADSGGRLRVKGTLDLLRRRFEVDLLTYDRPDNPTLAQARATSRVVEVPRTVTPRSAALRALPRLRNCGIMSHAEVDFGAPLAKLAQAHRYDVVVLDNTMLGHLIPAVRRLWPKAKVVVNAHNYETSLAAQLASFQSDPLRKAFFSFNAALTKRDEQRTLRAADVLWVTSPDDAAAFARLAPDQAVKIEVIPNFIVAADYAGTAQPEGEAIILPGNMNFFPNVKAAHFFRDEIYPLVKAQMPGVRWYIVGKDTHPSIADFGRDDPSIVVTGYVPSVMDYVSRCGVVVAPLKHGSGTRLKILEAWAVERPVVSTSQGCEGLGCEDGRELVIADTPQAFADGVIRVLRDRPFAEGLARNAKAALMDRFDIGAVESRLMASLA